MIATTYATPKAVYTVREIECDLGGRGFEVEKDSDSEPALYHVHLAAEGDARCDCLGCLRWGHCKHCDTVRQLVNAAA